MVKILLTGNAKLRNFSCRRFDWTLQSSPVLPWGGLEHPIEMSAREFPFSNCLWGEPSFFNVCKSNWETKLTISPKSDLWIASSKKQCFMPQWQYKNNHIQPDCTVTVPYYPALHLGRSEGSWDVLLQIVSKRQTHKPMRYQVTDTYSDSTHIRVHITVQVQQHWSNVCACTLAGWAWLQYQSLS